MIEKIKYLYSRAMNLASYLTVIGLMFMAVVLINSIYEVVNYKYITKFPTIAIALLLLTAF